MKNQIKYTEVTHQWEGTAILRTAEGTLSEVPLGVESTQKRLTETGAKELFSNLPEGTITVEIKKNADVSIVYSADVEEFKKIAKVVEEPAEEVPTPTDLQPAPAEEVKAD